MLRGSGKVCEYVKLDGTHQVRHTHSCTLSCKVTCFFLNQFKNISIFGRWCLSKKWEMLWGCRARWDPSSATYSPPSPCTDPFPMWCVSIRESFSFFRIDHFMLATPVAFPIRSHTCTTYSECISVMTHNNEDTSTSKSTRLHERKDTDWKYDVTRSSYLMLTTPVAYSDSFTNCHECRGYLNSITNDDRQIIVRIFFIWCLDIVLLTIG